MGVKIDTEELKKEITWYRVCVYLDDSINSYQITVAKAERSATAVQQMLSGLKAYMHI